MSPIFAAYKNCNDELVIKDFGRVIPVHDIFYSGRLFLEENALIELDVFLWMLWEVMLF